MSDLVRFSRQANIAVITIENPPVNALSPGVPEGIRDSVERANRDPEVDAMVLIGGGRTFIAGADIREFGKPSAEQMRRTMVDCLRSIEDSSKAVVVAIHGTAFGGGLETAMAGHYRVIAPAAQVGQPEVKLGLIPGAGGTQRLPRLAGFAKALEMCAFGAPINAQDAVESGIADRIIEGDLLEGAIKFAKDAASKPVIKTRDRDAKLKDADPAIFTAARDKARKTRRLQMAPLAAIDAVEAASKLSFEEGLARESELFEECRRSTQSKALIHAFFGERTVAKIPDIPADVAPVPIQRAAIIGAGTMGGGIAMTMADAGISVIVKEREQQALDRGMDAIRKNYAGSVKSGRLSQAAVDRRLSLIKPQLAFDGFEEADLIIEAVFEDMAVKKQVFTEIDRIAKPACVLATNTSALDVDEIAAMTRRPQMVLGLHFFSPANIMRLLEIVRGKLSSNEVLITAMALAKKLSKVGVLARNSPGFIGNRMVAVYAREAQFLVEEGASVEDVNQALFDFGMAMGPLAMSDMAGNDILWMIQKDAPAPAGVRRPRVLEQLYKLGRMGQKAGLGWSKYDENRKPSPDPAVAALIEQTAKRAGIERRRVTKEEIVDRCILALVNEGARILEEGVALRAVDIDIVYLNGYGFPAWRGGPMFYADTVGLKNVLARIEEFEKQHGSELWAPAPLLKGLADAGGTFQVLDEETRLSR
jgi:3-hydroxyacyl-CoA dehydrogenase